MGILTLMISPKRFIACQMSSSVISFVRPRNLTVLGSSCGMANSYFSSSRFLS
jgi:hypothetical protein